MHKLLYSNKATKVLFRLKKQGQNQKLKKIKETLDKIKENPRHPGLHTHKNSCFKDKIDTEVFQSYVENNTPGAYRIFWHYGFQEGCITILEITPHP